MDAKFLIAGDKAVSVEFGNEISIEINTKVRSLQKELSDHPIAGVTELVPTYAALTVHYRPEVIRYGALVEELKKRIDVMVSVSGGKQIVKEIPVLYGGPLGEDLTYCAGLENTTTDEIIRKHSEHEYYIYMLGFAPGHPYMARFEEPFGFKRRESPRVKIPARSVVVQQNLSDIIPFEQPCGWNIIGSVPIDIFDSTREQPCLFTAGDWVRYVPVDQAEYDRIRELDKKGQYRVKTYERGTK